MQFQVELTSGLEVLVNADGDGIMMTPVNDEQFTANDIQYLSALVFMVAGNYIKENGKTLEECAREARELYRYYNTIGYKGNGSQLKGYTIRL